MGKSINPMCFLFHTQGEVIPGSAPGPIVLMSLQPAIPWLHSCIARLRFTGWIISTIHQPKL
jgi:hypothetical protein